MNVLYVAPDGTVRSGRLIDEAGPAEGEGATALESPAGARLAPADVRALLAPHHPTEPQREVLWRAHLAGYRVEKA